MADPLPRNKQFAAECKAAADKALAFFESTEEAARNNPVLLAELKKVGLATGRYSDDIEIKNVFGIAGAEDWKTPDASFLDTDTRLKQLVTALDGVDTPAASALREQASSLQKTMADIAEAPELKMMLEQVKFEKQIGDASQSYTKWADMDGAILTRDPFKGDVARIEALKKELLTSRPDMRAANAERFGEAVSKLMDKLPAREANELANAYKPMADALPEIAKHLDRLPVIDFTDMRKPSSEYVAAAKRNLMTGSAQDLGTLIDQATTGSLRTTSNDRIVFNNTEAALEFAAVSKEKLEAFGDGPVPVDKLRALRKDIIDTAAHNVEEAGSIVGKNNLEYFRELAGESFDAAVNRQYNRLQQELAKQPASATIADRMKGITGDAVSRFETLATDTAGLSVTQGQRSADAVYDMVKQASEAITVPGLPTTTSLLKSGLHSAEEIEHIPGLGQATKVLLKKLGMKIPLIGGGLAAGIGIANAADAEKAYEEGKIDGKQLSVALGSYSANAAAGFGGVFTGPAVEETTRLAEAAVGLPKNLRNGTTREALGDVGSALISTVVRPIELTPEQKNFYDLVDHVPDMPTDKMSPELRALAEKKGPLVAAQKNYDKAVEQFSVGDGVVQARANLEKAENAFSATYDTIKEKGKLIAVQAEATNTASPSPMDKALAEARESGAANGARAKDPVEADNGEKIAIATAAMPKKSGIQLQ